MYERMSEFMKKIEKRSGPCDPLRLLIHCLRYLPRLWVLFRLARPTASDPDRRCPSEYPPDRPLERLLARPSEPWLHAFARGAFE